MDRSPSTPSAGPEAHPAGSGIALDERTDFRETDGDHERFSHYVPKDEIVRAAVTGEPCTALCGKRWVPSRDPDRFPVCPECKAIYETAKALGN